MTRDDAEHCWKALRYMVNNCEFPKDFLENLEIIAERVREEIDEGQESVAVCAPNLDLVNHPAHYTSHPSGVECITVTEHMSFNVGNAIKYLWRADDKGDPIENLKKAAWYVEREIARRA